ncbi:MAG: hypothetical protein NC417_10995 [Candidatus Gastranaerophilales bacterium]|nr:hypothetical protein [Candidatus Gastranaerophilales bacterium]
MKNYEEMAESVLERRDRYVADRKRKIRKTASIVSVFSFMAVLGTGIWNAKILDNVLNIPYENMDDARDQDAETGVEEILFSSATDSDTTNHDAEMKKEMSENAGDTLKNYDTVDKLLGDAYALVKVEVLQADIENVRSYIYTSYDMKVLDVIYGAIDADGDIINVNMPGGTVPGNGAQEILSEVTEGKDAGDLSGVNQIVSDGNTDRLLSVGDKAYLFLRMESELSFAVVGEYRGAMLLENKNVIFDRNIIGLKEDVPLYGSEGGSMPESEFVEAINELIREMEFADAGQTWDKPMVQNPGDTGALTEYEVVWGDSYMDEAGRWVVLLTENTAENQEKVFQRNPTLTEENTIFEEVTYSRSYLMDLMERLSQADLPSVVSSIGFREERNRIEIISIFVNNS